MTPPPNGKRHLRAAPDSAAVPVQQWASQALGSACGDDELGALPVSIAATVAREGCENKSEDPEQEVVEPPTAVSAEAMPSAKQNWPLPGAHEQRALTMVLLGVALLLVVGPSGYCWLSEGRAEMADRYRGVAHRAPARAEDTSDGSCYTCSLADAASSNHHNRPALYMDRSHLNEVVSGSVNGLLMMVATVLGAIGADIPGRRIFAMGAASLGAYSFSMGFGSFVVESAKEEFSLSQLKTEYHEVRNMPEAEVGEMTCHYMKRGLSREDAKAVAEVLSKYEDFWVQHMMAEELGIQMPRGSSVALTSGLATGASFLFFGAIPLLGIAMSLVLERYGGPRWYRPQFATLVALALSAVALVVLGFFVSRAVGSRAPFSSSLLMLVNGTAASALAFWLSHTFTKLGSASNGDALGDALGGGEARALPPGEQRPVLRKLRSPSHLSLDLASPGALASDSAAWPSFRRRFQYGVLGLWIGASSLVVCMQVLERMAYESLRVFSYGWLTCITTGLGAVPFMLAGREAVGNGLLAVANAVASGMMLSASAGMLMEAHEHCGPKDWEIFVGLLAGGLFIRASECFHGDGDSEGEGEEDIVALHCAFVERKHFKKAMLIFTVMFCHSAAEGIAVGVAFSRQLQAQFGTYVSLLLAIHNVPEGLAVALVLVPRGVSAPLAAIIATLTSVPQPLLAIAAFLFVEAFRWLLPLGLAFAAGAMVYVCLHELLQEAAEQLGWRRALATTAGSFVLMSLVIGGLQALIGTA